MSAPRRAAAGALCVLAAAGAAGAAGCGGSGGSAQGTAPSSGTATSRATTTRPAATPSARPPRDPLALPPNVPTKATGHANPAAVRVIRRWLAALDRGDVKRAAHFFALPSRFQNAGTPVLTVDTEIERIAINVSLSCGARAIRTGGAGPFTIVTFRLMERPGGNCGRGTGQTARGAILVRRGRIREWYRLPDEPAAGDLSGPTA